MSATIHAEGHTPRVGPDARARVMLALLAMAGMTVAYGGCGATAVKTNPLTLLREAKASVDSSSSVHISLTSSGVSGGGITVTGGQGDLARPDQLQGSFTVSIDGFPAQVYVVAVGDVFVAKFPFSKGYSRANPANFGLTNPAQLMDRAHGLSTLLALAQDPRSTGEERLGGELLDKLAFTVPGSAIPVLPDADPSQPVSMTVAIDPLTHELRQASLTGPFISRTARSTFVLTLTKYDEHVAVTLPPTS